MAVVPPSSHACAFSPSAAAAARILGAVLLLYSGALLAPSPASAVGAQFERSVYGAAAVSDAAGRTDIRVINGPGGLRLNTVLDPTKTYRLAIDGRLEAGSINMRLSFDGRLDYRASPRAREFVRVSGTTNFEVLLYSDSAAAYHLGTLELEECIGACNTLADLKALVLAETPGLESALASADHGLSADLLLEWAAARIPMGAVALDTHRLSAAELYFDYFRPLERGVYCFGAADFFNKLLRLFDISSFKVDFGTTVDALTHVTVVLVDERPGAVRWRIVDPTFAMTFRLPAANGPLSLDQILEADRVGLSEQIMPTLGDLANRTVVLTQDLGEDPRRVRCQDDDDQVFSVCSLAAYGRSFNPLLVRNGFTPGLPGIFELFRRGQLYDTRTHGAPADFVAMQERFRSAASLLDTTTVLAELPIRPVPRRPAELSGGALEHDVLTLAELDWHPRAPAETVTIGWERCAAGGGACRELVAAGPTYRLGAEDVGQRIRAVITAINVHGRATLASPVSEIVKALPIGEQTHGVTSGDGALHTFSRLAASRLSARTARVRVLEGGLRYTTAGRLTVPHELSRGTACRGGSVSVRVTRGSTVLSRRTVRLSPHCTYRSIVVFRNSAKLRRGHLRFVARFTGNDLLLPRSARAQLVPGWSMPKGVRRAPGH